jgi:hypothetical protein
MAPGKRLIVAAIVSQIRIFQYVRGDGDGEDANESAVLICDGSLQWSHGGDAGEDVRVLRIDAGLGDASMGPRR